MNKRTINTAWRKVAALAVFITVTALSVMAETQALRPYAYVLSGAFNLVDTGYIPQPCSRLFLDFRLSSTGKNRGIMGCNDGDLVCVFFERNVSNKTLAWYYNDSGTSYSTFINADTERRVLNVTHDTDSSETAVLDLYGRTNAITKTSNATHSGSTTSGIKLFGYKNDTDAIYHSRTEVYCFEAADTSDQTMPTAFLAPTTNALGEAGFVDVMTGTFHGEAMTDPEEALRYTDGIGSASDYKCENRTLYAKFRAYAADDATGGVKFGSDAASGTAEAWVARGGMVTLTAVPKEGWEFAGWTGDTWAIAGGSTMSDATVTLTNASTAVQLLAKFRDPSWHWTGAAGDGSWFTPGNWADSDGVAATALASGDKFTFDQAGAVTVNYNPASADFAIAKIAFATGAGAVTVTNGEMHVAAIVVENGAENVMSNAVAFTKNIDVTATSGHVRFAGGATGSGIANHFDLYGNYTLTQNSIYTPASGTTLKSGSTFTTAWDGGGIKAHDGQYTTESATTTTVAHAIIDSNSQAHICDRHNGVFVVTEYVRIDDNGYNKTDYFDYGGNGTLIANKMLLQGNVKFVPTAHTVMGSGGIDSEDGCYVRMPNDGSKKFGAYADWEMKNATEGAPVIYKQGNASSGRCVLTFDTTDYYNSSVKRKIMSRSPFGATIPANLSVAVTGIGTFAFACANEYDELFSGGLTVSNSATVSVLAGAKPGAGAVTLEDEATLEVAESGTVTLGGALTLGDNATLAFNFTEEESAPQLVGTSATLPETTVNVKVTAADGLRVRGGPYTLTSGMDFSGKTVNLVDKPGWVRSVAVDAEGNLVLTRASKGLIILFH